MNENKNMTKVFFDTEFLTQTEKEKIIYDSALGDTKKMIELYLSIIIKFKVF